MSKFLPYLLQSTLCLSLFWLMFRMVMRKDYHFGLTRMLLLTLVLLSVAIPLIPIPISIHAPVRMEMLPVFESIGSSAALNSPVQSISTETASAEIPQATVNEVDKGLPSIPQLLFYGYLMGLVVSLLILIRGVASVLLLTRKAKYIPMEGFRLLVVEREVPAFSFGRWVVLSQSDYEQHRLPLLAHEQAHIRLYHFYDLLLLEIAKIIYWFNPLIYLMAKDLKEIHEFQADDYTLTHGIDATQYQLLIIQKGVGYERFALANSFNHCQIKKRITMMNQSKNKKGGKWKVALFLPIVAFLLMAFGRQDDHVIDFLEPKNPNIHNSEEKPSLQNGISDKQLAEYENIVSELPIRKGVPDPSHISDANKKRLEKLYLAMNAKQKAAQRVVFIPAPPPLPKAVPTIEQMKAWEDPKNYGLWINGKMVDNSDIKKYSNTDFASVFVSKLEKNAFNYGKHYYQVNLMTNECYTNYLSQRESAEKYLIATRQIKDEVKLSGTKAVDGKLNSEAVDSTKSQLYVVDGEIADQRRAKYFLEVGVESVTILKGKEATDKYGAKGENGVCEITLKKGNLKEKNTIAQGHIELVHADSLVINSKNHSIMYFYKAQVKFNEGKLNADYIEINKDSSLVYATGRVDSTGTINGRPVLILRDQEITASEIRYNYRTSKGIIYNIGEKIEF